MIEIILYFSVLRDVVTIILYFSVLRDVVTIILYFSVLRDVVTAMRGDRYSVSMLADRRKERSYVLNLIDLLVEDLAIMVLVSKL